MTVDQQARELGDESDLEEVVDATIVHELPAVRAAEAMIARGEISSDDVVAQRDKIRDVMQRVMTEGVHYGTIPGVSKPSLFKPGAEVLLVTFRLAPEYQSERVFEGPHLTVVSKCVLRHIPTSLFLGEGEGLCTTRESRYAYRVGVRVCPNCGADAIKKSKFTPKDGDYPGASSSDPPGWYCFGKVGGCGMNFAAADPLITEQETGRSDNPDLPDSWNTVLKMAAKRALVAVVLNATAASDIFTQDVEDSATAAAAEASPEPSKPAVKLPSGWKEWGARMTALGIPEPDQAAWLGGIPESVSGVVLWAKAKRLLVLLTEQEGVDFADEPRAVIRRAIAEAFDGLTPEGPAWRIGPLEDDRPTREEWQAANPALVEADEADKKAADDVQAEAMREQVQGEYAEDPDIKF